MRDTILELADQRQIRSLLTAFSIKDSLKMAVLFITTKGAETN